MLDNSMYTDLIQDNVIHYQQIFSVDCNGNTLMFHGLGLSIEISEKQKRLLACLLNNVHRKNDIIQVVWHENHAIISDNNYHQLLYQFRALLIKNGMTADIIKTVPRYGVRLDKRVLEQFDLLPPPVLELMDEPEQQCQSDNNKQSKVVIPLVERLFSSFSILSLLIIA